MAKISRAQQVADTLYRRIVVEKTLAPGEKLPSEVELAKELKVSRATLREGMRQLVLEGLVESRRGYGTCVRKQPELNLLELGRLRDLFEMRVIFEPRAAALACRRATEEEMEEILRQGGAVRACIQAGEDRSRADRAFHTAIVQATHNRFMMRLLPVISQAVDAAIGRGDHSEELARRTLADHDLLLEFLAARNAEGAEHAMAIHMLHAMAEMGLQEE